VKRKLCPASPFRRRTVCCILCNQPATLKPTNTLYMMLRSYYFANGELSKERLSRLPDYITEYNTTNFGY